MQAHERLSAAIEAASESGRPALVPFITAGYPEPADFIATLKAVASAGDVVELGIPFSDPMADGMTIQRSSFVALQKGVTLRWIFDQLDAAKGEIDAPLVMMSYLNPLLAFGYDELAERALAAGVCGFIVPDLPFEESAELRAALEARGLGLVQLVTPATPEARLRTLRRRVTGVCLRRDDYRHHRRWYGTAGEPGGLPGRRDGGVRAAGLRRLRHPQRRGRRRGRRTRRRGHRGFRARRSAGARRRSARVSCRVRACPGRVAAYRRFPNAGWPILFPAASAG